MWERHFDLVALRREFLDPWRSGPPATYRHRRARRGDRRGRLGLPQQPVPAEGVLVVDGLFCQRPEGLDGCWDVVVFLDVPFEVSVARMAARDGSPDDVEHPDQRRYVDAQRIYFRTCDPQRRADLVIDNR